jgi:hypothetical protein
MGRDTLFKETVSVTIVYGEKQAYPFLNGRANISFKAML